MKNIVDQIAAMAAAVEDGDANALSAYVDFKRIEKVLEASMKQVFDEALVEASKYSEKSFACNGAEVTKKSNPGKWDYKNCPRVVELADKTKEVQEQAKVAYTQSQKGMLVIDDEGCVIEPAFYTSGGDGLSIKILSL